MLRVPHVRDHPAVRSAPENPSVSHRIPRRRSDGTHALVKHRCDVGLLLCGEFGIYAVDALYFKTAIDANGILISLDEEDFLSKVRTNPYHIEVRHPSDFSD